MHPVFFMFSPKNGRWYSAACMGAFLFLVGCSSVGGNGGCRGVALEAGNCLVFEDGLSSGAQDVVEQEVRRTLTAVNALMPVGDVQITVIVDPQQVIPEVGLGGFSPSDEEVQLFVDPGRAGFTQVLTTELFPILAHELHHARRRQTVGYGTTLLEAAVSEGLADHFSLEVTGREEPPPWSTALTGGDLEAWIAQASEVWNAGSYSHDAWFFGVGGEIPRWAGYAIGYEVVRAYLAEHPGRRASGLFDEPAASFLP